MALHVSTLVGSEEFPWEKEKKKEEKKVALVLLHKMQTVAIKIIPPKSL